MLTSKIKLLVTVLVLGLLLSACSLGSSVSFGPPESCGDDIGGTADTAKFDQYFTNMALVNQDGVSGPEGENGMEFASTDTLDLRADSISDVAVRACIQSRSGGPIAFDQTQTLTQGPSGLTLGSFQLGNYVVRVIVDGTLVKNFPFSIK